MIAKHISMKVATKSSFLRLVSYLTDSQGKTVRTGATRITNCMNDSAEVAALEILNTQGMNTRSTADKTYHLIISFRSGEDPDLAALAAIEERLCDGLGFAGHQRVSVVHDDTDNPHLHIAINKIHPTRYTIHEPFQAYRTLAMLCDKLEDEYSLQKDNHTPKKTASESRAADMEHHTGVESLIGWVKRECKERLRGARSWDELHGLLLENGLRMHPRANGLVITAADGTTIKASSVGREFSKLQLEGRLGPFQAAPVTQETAGPVRGYEKKPLVLRVDTTVLYARYQAAQAKAAEQKVREREQARARKERRIGAVKRSIGLKRSVLKLATMPRSAKKLMYSTLSRARSEEIAAIKLLYRREREANEKQHRRWQWSDWLRREAERGDLEALAALRGRCKGSGLTGNAVTGDAGPSRPARPSGHDSVTRKGTIIYHVAGSAIRDDGDRINVSLGADQAAMQSALRMAVERYGDRIAVNGSDAFKEQILMAAVAARMRVTFVDPVLEQRRLQLLCASPPGSGPNAMLTRPTTSYEGQRISSDSRGDRDGSDRARERDKAFDVPKQAPCKPLHPGAATFAGMRQVGGQMLALLKQDQREVILEVDNASARTLMRLPLGARVAVNARGVIKAKGHRK
jgi:hypothetical protein